MHPLCRAIILLSLILSSFGCTAVQLRKSASQQLRTPSDIIQQQIMDNVAKTSANRDAWPEFANLSGGSTQVTDQGNTSVALTWDPRSIITEMLGLGASRQIADTWQVTPITDPARLRAMSAVYTYTVYGEVSETATYSGSLQLQGVFGTKWKDLIPAPGWFCTMCEHECCEKMYCGCVVGHHCDLRACVLPGHQADLQQLTYDIMYVSSVTIVDKEGKPTAFPTGIPPLSVEAQSGTHEMRASPRAPQDQELTEPRTGPAREFIPSGGPVYVPNVR
jgi:hypothetical protein